MTGLAAGVGPGVGPGAAGTGCGPARAGVGGGSGSRKGSAVIGTKTGRARYGISTLAWGEAVRATEDHDGRHRLDPLSGDPRGGRLVPRPRALPPGGLRPARRRLRADRPVRAGEP